MTNAETISKLNNALQTLIKAYEELQEKNNNNLEKIAELEEDVLNLELVKEALEKEVSELKDNTEQDKTNIYSMLGKIEDILSKKDEAQYVSFSKPENEIKEEQKQEDTEEDTQDESESNLEENSSEEDKAKDESAALLNSFENVLNKKEEQKDDNKLDLSRMSSLLNGFNS